MTMDELSSDARRVLPEQRVGAALRQAREKHGVSLRKLAEQLGYNSHTTLSAYERGSTMPTEQVVEGYEQVLGLAPGSLTGLLEEANTERHGDAWSKRRVHIPTQFTSEDQPQIVTLASSRKRSRLFWIMTAVTLVVVASAISAVALWPSPSHHNAVPPSSAPTIISGPLDGVDPKVMGCASGAGNADSVDVHDPPEHLIGRLELRFSSACGTSWGRFTPTPALTTPPPIMIEINAHRPADNGVARYAVQYDGQPAYGNMLVSRNECVYVELILHRGETTSPAVKTGCRRGTE